MTKGPTWEGGENWKRGGVVVARKEGWDFYCDQFKGGKKRPARNNVDIDFPKETKGE